MRGYTAALAPGGRDCDGTGSPLHYREP